MTGDGAHDRGAVTRAALTASARDAFLEVGYDAASVAEIVAGAHSSVGSLYHHFGGKADLWLAVYRDHQLALRHQVADTVGETRGDAFEVFLTGTRAYLDACWQQRELVVLFAAGDHPPGWGPEVGRQFGLWLQANVDQLAPLPMPLSRTLVLALTTLAQTAGREVAQQPSREKARRVRDEFLVIMRRLYPG